MMKCSQQTGTLFEQRLCPVCGSPEHRYVRTAGADPFYRERFGIEQATIVSCRNCHFQFTNPVLSPEAEALQYLEGEGYNSPLPETLETLPWEDQIVCFLELKTLLNGTAKQILDFGCGAGGFVYLCQKNGLEAWGVELNVNAVARAGAVGIKNVSSSDLASLGANRFDVITCLHVFEHLADCRSVVSEFNRVLRPGGLVLAMTPSFDSFTLKLKRSRYWNFPYQHVNAFTSRSMDAMFLAEKFRRRRTAGRWLFAGPLLTRKCRLSMAITSWCGNYLNVFPTKLLCVYEKESPAACEKQNCEI